jgi:uncharacterized membrane protein YidH (DUF202 family)
MTYLAASLVVLASVLTAAAASLLIGRRVSVAARSRYHEIGHPVFLQIGVMLSVLLAFVFSEAWGEYNTAAQSINGECGALHGAAMLAAALPAAQGQPVVRAIADYAQTVVRSEWPAMAGGRESALASGEFRAAMDLAARLELSRPADLGIQNHVLSLLALAHADRETRIFQMTRGLPIPMWTVLILISLVLVLFVLFAGIEPPAHIALTTAFTGCTVLVLVLMRMLDYPFEGALALGDGDFIKTFGLVSALARGV